MRINSASGIHTASAEQRARTHQQNRPDLVIHAPDGPKFIVDVAVAPSPPSGYACKDVARQEQLKRAIYGANDMKRREIKGQRD